MKYPLLTYAEQCVIPPADRQSARLALAAKYHAELKLLREGLTEEFIDLVGAFTLADSALEQRIREAVIREVQT